MIFFLFFLKYWKIISMKISYFKEFFLSRQKKLSFCWHYSKIYGVIIILKISFFDECTFMFLLMWISVEYIVAFPFWYSWIFPCIVWYQNILQPKLHFFLGGVGRWGRNWEGNGSDATVEIFLSRHFFQDVVLRLYLPHLF